MTMLEDLKGDAKAYEHLGRWYAKVGFWVGATYRLGAWAEGLPAPVRFPVKIQYQVLKLAWKFGLNVQVDPKAKIGPGFCLVHPNNLFVPETEIGNNVTIFHDVTIGRNHRRPGYPKIGSFVAIAPGARILGDVKVGDYSLIGANCVVTSSVKPNTVVAPAPNRVANRPTPRRPP